MVDAYAVQFRGTDVLYLGCLDDVTGMGSGFFNCPRHRCYETISEGDLGGLRRAIARTQEQERSKVRYKVLREEDVAAVDKALEKLPRGSHTSPELDAAVRGVLALLN